MKNKAKDIPIIIDSAWHKILRIIQDILNSNIIPVAGTESSLRCGKYIGAHLFDLFTSCSNLNIQGNHSTAVSLFRSMEDALDCFSAVTILAGAAEKWEAGKLKASDAAKLLEPRFGYINPITNEKLTEYRKIVRTAFNKFAHCGVDLIYWNVFLEKQENGTIKEYIKKEDNVLEYNGYIIDTYLLAFCDELLHAVEFGYRSYFDRNTEVEQEIGHLKDDLIRLLQERMYTGFTGSSLPKEVELQVEFHKKNALDSRITIKGKWLAEWSCSCKKTRLHGTVTIRQNGRVIKGRLYQKDNSLGKTFNITEEFIGVIENQKLFIDGVYYSINPKCKDVGYELNSFRLNITENNDTLEGSHYCLFGKGDAKFTKI